MRIFSLRTAAVVLAAGIGLGGCATYSPFGYGSGVSVSLGSGYDPYYDRYSRYGYGYGAGYGSPYWGWNDGYYYPGTGYYVYDRFGRPYYWSDAQRFYWIKRRPSPGSTTSTSGKLLQNWADFAKGGQTTSQSATTRSATTQSVTTQSVTTRGVSRSSALEGRDRTVRVEHRASRERDEARTARAERRERVLSTATEPSPSDETSTRRRGNRDD